jgi:hypothetical protein
MAQLTKGKTFTSGETVEPADMHQLVDNATVSEIVNADIKSDAAIALSKLATGALPTAITVATANLVDANVTQAKFAANVAGNGPTFRAHASAATTLSNNGFTKIALGAEGWDTGSFFDTSTSRFTPTVAGYYWFNAAIQVVAGADLFNAVLYKNGAAAAYGMQSDVDAYRATVSDIIYLNGSSDYVELFGYQFSGTTKTTGTGAENTYLSGCLIRAA